MAVTSHETVSSAADAIAFKVKTIINIPKTFLVEMCTSSDALQICTRVCPPFDAELSLLDYPLRNNQFQTRTAVHRKKCAVNRKTSFSSGYGGLFAVLNSPMILPIQNARAERTGEPKDTT